MMKKAKALIECFSFNQKKAGENDYFIKKFSDNI